MANGTFCDENGITDGVATCAIQNKKEVNRHSAQEETRRQQPRKRVVRYS